jgi:hypothetical protein
MHNDGHGIGGNHLLPCVLTCLKAKGHHVLAELDERSITSLITSGIVKLIIYLNFRFNDMPSWSGLIHFNQVVSLNFTDAKKLDHLVKVFSLFL